MLHHSREVVMRGVDDRPEPVELAAQALRRRDHTRAELDARLRRAGIGPGARLEALETLERVGYLDDARFAAARAATLAERGYGDDAIRRDLESRGLSEPLVEPALDALAPEAERAAALVRRLGRTPRTLARLARKGFSAEAVEAAAGALEPDG